VNAVQSGRARTLLRELERYGPLFASTTDYVFAKDLSGRYIAANAAFLSAVGRTAGDVIGRDDRGLFSAPDASEQRAREQLVELCGRTLENEAALPLQGEERALVVRRSPWRDRAGRLIGTIGVATDITHARAARRPQQTEALHLRGSNARLQQMLDDQTRMSRRMSLLLDAGRELIATLERARIHQIAVDVVEQSLDDVASAFACFDRASSAWIVRAAGLRAAGLHLEPQITRGDAPFSDDLLAGRVFSRRRTAGGRFPFDAALASAGCSGYVAVPVMYDQALQAALVTAWSGGRFALPEEVWFLETFAVQVSLALHNAALYEQLDTSLRALKQAQDQASHAHHLQALGQVASGVAHDFNNSLTTILGLSDWLLHELPPDTPFYTDLETIRTAAQDAAAMVRRLQMFGRLRRNARPDVHEAVNLADVARAVADLSRPRVQELAVTTGRPYDVAVDAVEAPLVMGSAAELRELLVNLVFNGLDAMPDGGTVRVTVGHDSGRPTVAVTDAGVGIGEDVQRRIFEPFFSTKGHKGNGLGLAMCEGIAERHGATLSVASVPGAGSTFTLAFPAGALTQVTAAAASPAAAAAAAALSVLVVDDRADVCDSLGAMVSALGHAVTKARDGAAALDMIIARRFDVLVTDLGMPGMNGLELARSVAACRPGTALVIITAWGSEFEAESSTAGIRVVAKPVTMAALQQALIDALGRAGAGRGMMNLVPSSEAAS